MLFEKKKPDILRCTFCNKPSLEDMYDEDGRVNVPMSWISFREPIWFANDEFLDPKSLPLRVFCSMGCLLCWADRVRHNAAARVYRY